MSDKKTKGVDFANIPQELKTESKFCLWKYEKHKGNLTKVPYNPNNGQHAETNNPSTFAAFKTAMLEYAMGGWDGIGIRVANGIGAIDIDHCIREDGSLNDVAASILSSFPDAYFEVSPSGKGLRGFFRVPGDYVYDQSRYYIKNSQIGLEVYISGSTNRFVTVTGNMFRQGSIYRNDDALQSVIDKYMKRKTLKKAGFSSSPVSYLTDDQVIEHASDSALGEKFKALYEGQWEGRYGSQSEADMALVSILTFWCGRVEEQIDRIFRSSGLMRDKWDRKTGDSTYGMITIRNAISQCTEVYQPAQVYSEKCSPKDEFVNLDACDIQAERDRREREGYSFTPDLRFLDTSIESLAPQSNPRYESFEIGNANMFVDYFRKIILMNDTRGCWYIYDGRVWRPDIHNLRISEMAKNFHNALLFFAPSIKSEDTRERFLERVSYLDRKKFRDSMIKDASSDESITVRMEAFDSDKYLFNCHNGTIDLRTLEFRSHSPADRITKLTEVDYDPYASCPRWLSFMEEVCEGDIDRIRYLQKAIGYAMSGDTKMECMFILYGETTRNGKGTLMETILRIMGEYGRTANPEMFVKNNYVNSSGPSEDVARLNGARLVSISEPEKSMVINASLTKKMTGNNILTARFLHENSIEFKPQFKLFIDTNHLPQITDMTLLESDRICVIPFNRHFSEEERDKNLKAFFAQPSNLSAILNWCLEGYRLFQAEGLDRPESVKSATIKYREQSDCIGLFVSQCIKHEDGQELRSSAVYNRFKQWCVENGYKDENMANFKKMMERAGFVYARRRPWNEKNCQMTTMINNVAWIDGEEPESEFVPLD